MKINIADDILSALSQMNKEPAETEVNVKVTGVNNVEIGKGVTDAVQKAIKDTPVTAKMPIDIQPDEKSIRESAKKISGIIQKTAKRATADALNKLDVNNQIEEFAGAVGDKVTERASSARPKKQMLGGFPKRTAVPKAANNPTDIKEVPAPVSQSAATQKEAKAAGTLVQMYERMNSAIEAVNASVAKTDYGQWTEALKQAMSAVKEFEDALIGVQNAGVQVRMLHSIGVKKSELEAAAKQMAVRQSFKPESVGVSVDDPLSAIRETALNLVNKWQAINDELGRNEDIVDAYKGRVDRLSLTNLLELAREKGRYSQKNQREFDNGVTNANGDKITFNDFVTRMITEAQKAVNDAANVAKDKKAFSGVRDEYVNKFVYGFNETFSQTGETKPKAIANALFSEVYQALHGGGQSVISIIEELNDKINDTLRRDLRVDKFDSKRNVEEIEKRYNEKGSQERQKEEFAKPTQEVNGGNQDQAGDAVQRAKDSLEVLNKTLDSIKAVFKDGASTFSQEVTNQYESTLKGKRAIQAKTIDGSEEGLNKMRERFNEMLSLLNAAEQAVSDASVLERIQSIKGKLGDVEAFFYPDRAQRGAEPPQAKRSARAETQLAENVETANSGLEEAATDVQSTGSLAVEVVDKIRDALDHVLRAIQGVGDEKGLHAKGSGLLMEIQRGADGGDLNDLYNAELRHGGIAQMGLLSSMKFDTAREQLSVSSKITRTVENSSGYLKQLQESLAQARNAIYLGLINDIKQLPGLGNVGNKELANLIRSIAYNTKEQYVNGKKRNNPEQAARLYDWVSNGRIKLKNIDGGEMDDSLPAVQRIRAIDELLHEINDQRTKLSNISERWKSVLEQAAQAEKDESDRKAAAAAEASARKREKEGSGRASSKPQREIADQKPTTQSASVNPVAAPVEGESLSGLEQELGAAGQAVDQFAEKNKSKNEVLREEQALLAQDAAALGQMTTAMASSNGSVSEFETSLNSLNESLTKLTQSMGAFGEASSVMSRAAGDAERLSGAQQNQSGASANNNHMSVSQLVDEAKSAAKLTGQISRLFNSGSAEGADLGISNSIAEKSKWIVNSISSSRRENKGADADAIAIGRVAAAYDELISKVRELKDAGASDELFASVSKQYRLDGVNSFDTLISRLQELRGQFGGEESPVERIAQADLSTVVSSLNQVVSSLQEISALVDKISQKDFTHHITQIRTMNKGAMEILRDEHKKANTTASRDLLKAYVESIQKMFPGDVIPREFNSYEMSRLHASRPEDIGKVLAMSPESISSYTGNVLSNMLDMVGGLYSDIMHVVTEAGQADMVDTSAVDAARQKYEKASTKFLTDIAAVQSAPGDLNEATSSVLDLGKWQTLLDVLNSIAKTLQSISTIVNSMNPENGIGEAAQQVADSEAGDATSTAIQESLKTAKERISEFARDIASLTKGIHDELVKAFTLPEVQSNFDDLKEKVRELADAYRDAANSINLVERHTFTKEEASAFSAQTKEMSTLTKPIDSLVGKALKDGLLDTNNEIYKQYVEVSGRIASARDTKTILSDEELSKIREMTKAIIDQTNALLGNKTAVEDVAEAHEDLAAGETVGTEGVGDFKETTGLNIRQAAIDAGMDYSQQIKMMDEFRRVVTLRGRAKNMDEDLGGALQQRAIDYQQFIMDFIIPFFKEHMDSAADNPKAEADAWLNTTLSSFRDEVSELRDRVLEAGRRQQERAPQSKAQTVRNIAFETRKSSEISKIDKYMRENPDLDNDSVKYLENLISDISALTGAYEDQVIAFKTARAEFQMIQQNAEAEGMTSKQVNKALRESRSKEQIEQQRDKMMNTLFAWTEKNPEADKKYKERINKLFADLFNVDGTVDEMRSAMLELRGEMDSIISEATNDGLLSTQIRGRERLQSRATNLRDQMERYIVNNPRLNADSKSEINQIIKEINDFNFGGASASGLSEFENRLAGIARRFGEIKQAANEAGETSSFDKMIAEIDVMTTKLDALLATASDDFIDKNKESINTLRTDLDKSITDPEQLTKNVRNAKTLLDQLMAESGTYQKLADRRKTLKGQIDEFEAAGNNAKIYAKDIAKLRDDIDNTNASLNDQAASLDKVEQSFENLQSKSVAGSWSEAWKELLFGRGGGEGNDGMVDELLDSLSIGKMVDETVQQLGEMVNVVKETDAALTELRKVTDGVAAEYKQFTREAVEMGRSIGVTMNNMIASSADFARLGYSIKESLKLAEVANLYMVVGDEIKNIDDATASIISTMQAFGIEAENAMMIADEFNEVGNKSYRV